MKCDRDVKTQLIGLVRDKSQVLLQSPEVVETLLLLCKDQDNEVRVLAQAVRSMFGVKK